MKITDENWKRIITKALGKAWKKGFQRQMFFGNIKHEVDCYDFCDEEDAIRFIVKYLMSVEKVCKMLDGHKVGKIGEFDIKATKWCVW